MNLTTSCIITENIEQLSEFYERVLQLEAHFYGEDYVEFETETADLSLFSLKEHEKLAADSAVHGTNKNVLLEFMVEDVEKEYERLIELGVNIIKEPTTQPWGNRSIYFEDPDGNILNFYTPQT